MISFNEILKGGEKQANQLAIDMAVNSLQRHILEKKAEIKNAEATLMRMFNAIALNGASYDSVTVERSLIAIGQNKQMLADLEELLADLTAE